ncbi:hypothetical protein [Streptomyces sp. NPDC097619]|uniref:hypothetical protein n=1 Tax=Streptomyces sp. NPDC097619 TaxID=3157228 RepID=UPI00332EEA91
MDVPNVFGDWQEYQSQEWAGLRVRVHGLRKAVPSRGRHRDARGLTYLGFHVTFENRGAGHFEIELTSHPYHYNVRVGRDGHGPFVDEQGADRIDGFNLYPQRRVTATLYVAAPSARLAQVDVQVSPSIGGETAFGYVWVGGLGVHEGPARPGARSSAVKPSVAGEVERFLKERASGEA